MSLTVDAYGTAATVSDPGGIEHAHRPIMFGGVAPVDKVVPLADNAKCRRVVGESRVLPGLLFVLHVPSAVDRRMILSPKGSGMVGPQFERGENSVRRIEVGCHC